MSPHYEPVTHAAVACTIELSFSFDHSEVDSMLEERGGSSPVGLLSGTSRLPSGQEACLVPSLRRPAPLCQILTVQRHLAKL